MAQKDPSIGARFSKIRNVFCDGKNLLFAQKIGVSPQNASGYCNGQTPVGPKIIEQTLTAFPQVSRVWLVLGEGDMLRTTKVSEELDVAPLSDENGNDYHSASGNNSNALDVINRLVTIIENKDKQVASLISMLGDKYCAMVEQAS